MVDKSNSKMIWIVVVCLNIATFCSGLAIGFYKTMSELKPLISTNQANIENLTKIVDRHEGRIYGTGK